MKNNDVIELAIKRHDLDANWFQNTYLSADKPTHSSPFIYGRKLVLEELESLLKNLPKRSKILDVGSGTGHLTKWLKEKGYEVQGLEPSEEMLNYARNNFPDIHFSRGISSELPYVDNEFDLIVSFEVLRYLNKNVNVQTYQEFYRVLKPQGQFFVTHVNKYAFDLYYFFYFIKGLFYRLKNLTYHYCYFTTPNREEKIIKKIGFSSVSSVGRMDGKIRIARKLGRTTFNIYKKISELLYGKQRFLRKPFKLLAGHLIMIGKK